MASLSPSMAGMLTLAIWGFELSGMRCLRTDSFRGTMLILIPDTKAYFGVSCCQHPSKAKR